MDKKYIKKFINFEFFDMPKSRLKSFYYSKKLRFMPSSLELLNASLIVCNKSSEFDEYLLNRTIASDFVILKEHIIEKIYTGSLDKYKMTKLLNEFMILKNALISVVVFAQPQMSILGVTKTINEEMTEFLFESGLDLKFISFSGAFFAKPLWSDEIKSIQTKPYTKFCISHSALELLSPAERNKQINKFMPSRASNYNKYELHKIRSNNRAVGLEQVIFACPECGKFFSIYSEFNCIKCSECSAVFELTTDGNIFSRLSHFELDEFEESLDNIIKNTKFSKSEIYSIEKITLNIFFEGTIAHSIQNLHLSVFKDHLELSGIDFIKNINFKDVILAKLEPNNTLKLILSSSETLSIQAPRFKNLYLIIKLIEKIKK